VEDQFYNASAFAAVLKKERVRGTFFLLGVEAEKNPEVVKELAEVGEIGSHSMRHEDFTQKSEADQRQELKETVDLMHRLGVAQVVGFRPPFEGYNEATLHMLADSGMRFIYGSEDFVAAWPREVRYDDHWFYQFPRIVRDDYNIVAEKQSEAPEAYLAAFREDLAFMRRFGGLYPFSAHTNYLMKPDALPAVSGFLAEVRRTDVWLATLSEVVDWVEERRDVSVTCTEKECRVRNGGARAVTRFPLAAYRMGLTVPPALANKVIALPRTDGGTILAFDLQPSEEVALPLAPAR
jgi:peptidoglycan/xylan/chitin deacetylase (PgdA/CDA1 family)